MILSLGFLLSSLVTQSSGVKNLSLSSTFLSKPVLRTSFDEGQPTPSDFTLTQDDFVYVIFENSPAICKYDLSANQIEKIQGSHLPIIQPVAIESNRNTVIVADSKARQLHFFPGGAYQKSITLPGNSEPKNLAVTDDRIISAGFGYANYSGGIFLFDMTGKMLKSFVPDIDPSPHTNEQNSLWTGIVMSPLGNQTIMGFVFQPRAFILNRNGEISVGSDLRGFYAAHERDAKGLVLPDGFAAVDFCCVSNEQVIVVVCDNQARRCGTLMLFDSTLTTRLETFRLEKHLWKLKYASHKKRIGFIDSKHQIEIYLVKP